MIAAIRPLPRLLRVLLLGLLVLGVIAKPLLASAHELHEIAHALQAQSDDASADTLDAGRAQLLHAVDCCFHASGIGVGMPEWSPMLLSETPPPPVLQPPPPSPQLRPLRPPIVSA